MQPKGLQNCVETLAVQFAQIHRVANHQSGANWTAKVSTQVQNQTYLNVCHKLTQLRAALAAAI
jgi:hypothetical protein